MCKKLKILWGLPRKKCSVVRSKNWTHGVPKFRKYSLKFWSNSDDNYYFLDFIENLKKITKKITKNRGVVSGDNEIHILDQGEQTDTVV